MIRMLCYPVAVKVCRHPPISFQLVRPGDRQFDFRQLGRVRKFFDESVEELPRLLWRFQMTFRLAVEQQTAIVQIARRIVSQDFLDSLICAPEIAQLNAGAHNLIKRLPDHLVLNFGQVRVIGCDQPVV